jgi:hypothetical protein
MFAKQVRTRSLWKWLGPLLVALAAAGGYAGWRWFSSQVNPAALEKRQEGLSALARDDDGSLERAQASFAEARRIDPKLYQAEADRALAMLLLAGGIREDAASLESRFKELEAERSRLETEKPEGWQKRSAEVIERMKPLKAQLDPLHDKAGSLADQAYGALRVLAREHGEDVAVARALAVYYALDGNADQTARLVKNARIARQADPWLDLAEGAADVTASNSQVTRERAVSRLGPLAAANPQLLRARMLLARAQVDLLRKDAAVATLDGVLAANAEHERARRLKGELLAPPPPKEEPAAAPEKAPPPRKAGKPPRRGGRRR